ncbi:MAG TPA: hypothetical protein DCQ98_07580 [Planctomycetaceae bacterium]|nr:hypothetical protein [Planctomycetaceae bacterium]HRF02807.1 hypothetical protein [Pirellulaceae bacterium]
MSLFEDDRYRYRETCFVLFSCRSLPDVRSIVASLAGLGDRYRLSKPETTPDGTFDSLTIRCPYDRSAMDITLVADDDIAEQVEAWNEEFRQFTLSDVDRAKLERLADFDCRFDIFHFEQIAASGDSADDDGDAETFDPGALLVVLQQLARLTGGIGVDPQSATLL